LASLFGIAPNSEIEPRKCGFLWQFDLIGDTPVIFEDWCRGTTPCDVLSKAVGTNYRFWLVAPGACLLTLKRLAAQIDRGSGGS